MLQNIIAGSRHFLSTKLWPLLKYNTHMCRWCIPFSAIRSYTQRLKWWICTCLQLFKETAGRGVCSSCLHKPLQKGNHRNSLALKSYYGNSCKRLLQGNSPHTSDTVIILDLELLLGCDLFFKKSSSLAIFIRLLFSWETGIQGKSWPWFLTDGLGVPCPPRFGPLLHHTAFPYDLFNVWFHCIIACTSFSSIVTWNLGDWGVENDKWLTSVFQRYSMDWNLHYKYLSIKYCHSLFIVVQTRISSLRLRKTDLCEVWRTLPLPSR